MTRLNFLLGFASAPGSHRSNRTGTDSLDTLLDDLLAPAAPPEFLDGIDDPVTWIQRNFYIPETGKPITLYDSQTAPLREALRTDERGNFVYSTVLWSAIKKSAKTSIAAAVGMWFAFRTPRARIKVMGNDQKQAQSRVYESMVTAVQLRPDWREAIKVNLYQMTFPNGSRIEATAVDPAGEAGGNDDLVIVTELWGWKFQKHQQMWTETTIPPTKHGRSIRWCESYAGYAGESPVLEQLYEVGVKQGEVIDAEREMYRNRRLFVLWNTRPTLPWQTDEYYADQAASLTQDEFRRVHRNEWVSGLSAFVPDSWWQSCVGDTRSVNLPVVVGLDAAVTNDCFAVVTVTRLGETLYVKECKVWTPPLHGQIDFDEVERYVKELARRYTVREFAYDPTQMAQMAQRLYGRVGFFKPFSQGQERLIADKALYDLIRDGRIVHPNDPTLNEHIANANAKLEGDKLRIVKRTDAQKIDAVVALSMACARATYYRIGGRA